jgi:hypothetical protein
MFTRDRIKSTKPDTVHRRRQATPSSLKGPRHVSRSLFPLPDLSRAIRRPLRIRLAFENSDPIRPNLRYPMLTSQLSDFMITHGHDRKWINTLN